MCNSQDHILTLERQVLEARGLYLESLARAERIECQIRREAEAFIVLDLLAAESELSRNRRIFHELLDRLGYLPDGLSVEPASDDRSP